MISKNSPGRVLCFLSALAALLVAVPGSRAQEAYDAFPVDPPDRASVGPRPRLRAGVHGEDVTQMQFRIEMSRDHFDTIHYTFDQREDSNGWAFVGSGFDVPGAVLNVRTPLEDGNYEWRVSVWNGFEWNGISIRCRSRGPFAIWKKPRSSRPET